MKKKQLDELSKLIIQAKKAVIEEGYSEKQVLELQRIIYDAFDNFLDEKQSEKSIEWKKYFERRKLMECSFYCFPFNCKI